jgi:hypothetical protein
MNPAPIKPLISTSDLDKIDVRVGTILAVTEKPLFAKRVRNRPGWFANGGHSPSAIDETAAPQFALSYRRERLPAVGPIESYSSSRGRLRNLWSVWVLHDNEEVYHAVV